MLFLFKNKLLLSQIKVAEKSCQGTKTSGQKGLRVLARWKPLTHGSLWAQCLWCTCSDSAGHTAGAQWPLSETSWYILVLTKNRHSGRHCVPLGEQVADSQGAHQLRVSWSSMAAALLHSCFSKIWKPEVLLSILFSYSITYSIKLSPYCIQLKGISYVLDKYQWWRNTLNGTDYYIYNIICLDSLKTIWWRMMMWLWLTVFRHLAKDTCM
jgi:hypothetical protein